MNDWYEQGQFPDALEVTQVPSKKDASFSESGFTKLSTFTKNGSVQRPFLPSSNTKQEDQKSEDDVLPFWYYKDPAGIIQGPFPIEDMMEWYAGNFLPDQTEIAGVKEDTTKAPTTFKTIESYETNPFVE